MQTEPNLAYLQKNIDRIRDFYNSAPADTTSAGRFYRKLLANYYRHLIPATASILEVGCGNGGLLSLLPNQDITGVDVSSRQIELAKKRIPYGKFFCISGEKLISDLQIQKKFDVIILSETINLGVDVQRILEQLHHFSTPHTRLILNFYSSLWRPILTLATWFGLKSRQPEANWLSNSDTQNLLRLSFWELIKDQPRILFPFPFFGLEKIFNKYLAYFLSPLCLTVFHVARPISKKLPKAQTVSVIIPARNEAGNIQAAVERTPQMGAGTEIIFVEGHSTDNTWQEIQRVARENPQLVILQQTDKGKGNAVREGFEKAKGDILMILDADLTVPPEELPKFYALLVSGAAEFANGVRLVYPMEDKAMRFLNMCANKFFSIAFSWILGQPIKDTLCGTKVLYKEDYLKISANRSYFGDFDPFGDFDLLFGASKLNLKMMDIPIRYRERTYGTTNIQRWKHGWLLLKMVVFSLRKIKFI